MTAHRDAHRDEISAWSDETRAERTRAALEKHGFDARYARDADQATELVMSFVKPGMKVGFGGSMTIRALGIQEKTVAAGAVVLDHGEPGLSPDERLEVMRAQLTCDLFLASSNAVSMKGELYNVDGNGNRIAALCFGPRKTIVVVGANKIVADEAEAWARIEAKAAPMNNRRLCKDNPCTKSGQCADCDSAGRICRIYQVLKRKPGGSDFTVILVGGELGY